MTNFEAYEDQLKELVRESHFGLDRNDNLLKPCGSFGCRDCGFIYGNRECDELRREWLDEEYVEPTVDWTKVVVDTPILVRDYLTQAWERRHFAKCENGKVFSFSNGRTSWSSNENETLEWNYAKLAEQE